jgi:hypothetical protein
MGWLFYHRNKQGLRVEPDESIAEHGENNKIEEVSSKLLSCLSNKDLLDSSYTNQSYRVLLTNTGVAQLLDQGLKGSGGRSSVQLQRRPVMTLRAD